MSEEPKFVHKRCSKAKSLSVSTYGKGKSRKSVICLLFEKPLRKEYSSCLLLRIQSQINNSKARIILIQLKNKLRIIRDYIYNYIAYYCEI